MYYTLTLATSKFLGKTVSRLIRLLLQSQTYSSVELRLEAAKGALSRPEAVAAFFQISPALMMEPTRSARGPTSSKRRQGGPLLAFYQPSNSTTSTSRIMAEARQSLRVPSTQRPFTPADSHRMLFGQRRTTSRPPSAYRYA